MPTRHKSLLYDTDHDGLSDSFELDIGTSPTNTNADRDALRDGCEWYLVDIHDVPLGLNVFDPDTDADGIPDAVETSFGINPTSNDTDQDILFDREEWDPCGLTSGLFWVTNALDPDRDGDGILDGIEVKSTGTDPDLYDTDGDSWSDHAEVLVYDTDPFDASDKPSGYPPTTRSVPTTAPGTGRHRLGQHSHALNLPPGRSTGRRGRSV